jgi:hypothetical protein
MLVSRWAFLRTTWIFLATVERYETAALAVAPAPNTITVSNAPIGCDFNEYSNPATSVLVKDHLPSSRVKVLPLEIRCERAEELSAKESASSLRGIVSDKQFLSVELKNEANSPDLTSIASYVPSISKSWYALA